MIDLSKFAENLSSCMQERGINAPALAQAVKTDRSNITRYLRGERLPSFDALVKLCDYFNISADVLLGKKDFSAEREFLPVGEFGKRLREVMLETGATQYSVEKDTGISGSIMYKWLFSLSLPSTENLERLADYMEISIDYLLGRIK